MRRLILRPGAIGDFIVSLPALERLRTEYTEIWTTETNRPLAWFADQTASLLSTGIDSLGLPGRPASDTLLQRLRSFDSIVSWYGTGRPEFREDLASLQLPVEFHRALPPEGIGMHAVDYYLAQVGAERPDQAGPTNEVAPRIPVQGQPRDAIVIHPFSGGRKKNWPLERFTQLATDLEAAGLGPVQWCAGPEEPLPEANRFDELGALAEWLAGARLFVGNDSGIGHLAAAVGVPVVALFGSTNPDIWAPRGPRVRVVRSADGSMQSIGVAEVWEAVRQTLGR